MHSPARDRGRSAPVVTSPVALLPRLLSTVDAAGLRTTTVGSGGWPNVPVGPDAPSVVQNVAPDSLRTDTGDLSASEMLAAVRVSRRRWLARRASERTVGHDQKVAEGPGPSHFVTVMKCSRLVCCASDRDDLSKHPGHIVNGGTIGAACRCGVDSGCECGRFDPGRGASRRVRSAAPRRCGADSNWLWRGGCEGASYGGAGRGDAPCITCQMLPFRGACRQEGSPVPRCRYRR